MNQRRQKGRTKRFTVVALLFLFCTFGGLYWLASFVGRESSLMQSSSETRPDPEPGPGHVLAASKTQTENQRADPLEVLRKPRKEAEPAPESRPRPKIHHLTYATHG